MSGFIDTHCHLNFNSFENDLSQVLARARQAGMLAAVIPGVDIPSSRSAVSLAGGHPDLFAAVGVHPNDAGGWDDASAGVLRELAALPAVKAVGEIGLDYYRQRTSPILQKEAFLAQLELAQELELPVVIHNRESIHDLWPILKGWSKSLRGGRPWHGVLHSFDGEAGTALEAFEHGFLIGISGPVTYRNADLRREVVKALPLESILLETDAPFLTPQPYRGRRNEPARIPLIAEEISRIKQINLSEVQLVTTRNASLLFSLGSLD